MSTYSGIDVSKYQQKIGWSKVDAHGIDFALIRIGMGNVASQIDPYFKTNVEQALAHGLNVGGYYFGYATSVSDAQKEADVCNQLLQPYKGKFTYPIAYDYEYDSIEYFKKVMGRAPTNAETTAFAKAFLDRLKSYGWFVNIYTNIDFIRSGKFSAEIIKSYDVWLADYSGAPDYPCYIQQTGSKGTVPGISGNVDMDVSFRDYPSMIKSGGYNGFTKQPQTIVSADTTTTVNLKRGQTYQLKTTCAQQPKVWAGTENVVTILPRYRSGNDDLWYIVGIGNVGAGTGIFTAADKENGLKRFVVNII